MQCWNIVGGFHYFVGCPHEAPKCLRKRGVIFYRALASSRLVPCGWAALCTSGADFKIVGSEERRKAAALCRPLGSDVSSQTALLRRFDFFLDCVSKIQHSLAVEHAGTPLLL